MSTAFERLVHTSFHGGGIALNPARPAGTAAKTTAPRRKSMNEQAAAAMAARRHPSSTQSRRVGCAYLRFQ